MNPPRLNTMVSEPPIMNGGGRCLNHGQVNEILYSPAYAVTAADLMISSWSARSCVWSICSSESDVRDGVAVPAA